MIDQIWLYKDEDFTSFWDLYFFGFCLGKLVTMQAQKEAPGDMQCKDKFLLQCVVASPGATPKDVTNEMVIFH